MTSSIACLVPKGYSYYICLPVIRRLVVLSLVRAEIRGEQGYIPIDKYWFICSATIMRNLVFHSAHRLKQMRQQGL